MMERILHCIKYLGENIIIINPDFQYKMGNSQNGCSFCNTVSSQQLEALCDSNNVGDFLHQALKGKRIFKSTFKDMSFKKQIPNLLFPNQSQKKSGIIYLPQKYLYQGAIDNSKPSGNGKFMLIGSKMKVEGSFENQKLEGKQCKVMFADPQMQFAGDWKNGLPVKIRYNWNSEIYLIEFQQNSFTKGKVTFPNGSQYNGQFHFDIENKKHVISGKGTLKYKNGDTLTGEFVDGYLEGEGEYRLANSNLYYKGGFRRGLFDGQGTCDLGENGVLKIGWRSNKPTGKGEHLYNGHTNVVHYQKGVRKYYQSSIIDQ